MESRNEKHVSMDQLMRLVATVRFLTAAGRTEQSIAEDLAQSHGLTNSDIKALFKLAIH